jgi:hypothetical protein
MRITTLLVSVFILLAGVAQAQSQDEASVRAVIDKLFKGMEKGDSAMVHSAFGPSVNMATIFRDKTNTPQIRHETSLDGFLKAVGTAHKETWYEEIWNVKILVDGDLAQAWCDYAFYADKTFSHCGVDAFLLHKTADGWKIFQLADTRRKADCKVPEEIQAKHK